MKNNITFYKLITLMKKFTNTNFCSVIQLVHLGDFSSFHLNWNANGLCDKKKLFGFGTHTSHIFYRRTRVWIIPASFWDALRRCPSPGALLRMFINKGVSLFNYINKIFTI